MEVDLNSEMMFTVASLISAIVASIIGGVALEIGSNNDNLMFTVPGVTFCIIAVTLLFAFVVGLINLGSAVLG